ncbi:MAG: LppX_LprAFG lipoprotein [Actinomycetota bacterium]|nr:LppX_LprAFG lipoprotein [Actinomycetota bacterium]
MSIERSEARSEMTISRVSIERSEARSELTIRRLAALGLVLAIATLPACTSTKSTESSGRADSARALLAAAKGHLDATSSLRFVLISSGVPRGTSSLTGGKGVAARPDIFKGDLTVDFAGAQVSVGVIAIGGKTYAKLPFTTSYTVTDPSKFGVGDPGRLLDPETGISNLLVVAKDPQLGKKSRIGSEVIQEITATIPGAVIKSLLASANPTKDVKVTFGVAENSKLLRRAVVTGPFFKSGVDSTYTIVLDHYGDRVDIRAPSTG